MENSDFKRSSLIVAFLLLLLFNGCSKNKNENEDDKKNGREEVKVGAWYFGGWSFPPDENGHTFHISPTLVTQFSDREPLWGWREDDPDIMVDQINYAADAGLSFWGFCWYENTLVSNPKLMDNLNNALDLFENAPNKERLDFFLYSVHPVSPVNWGKLCDKTIRYFKQPNYLKVDEKPVMVFFNTDEVIEGMGGMEGTREALELFREKARLAGIGEILIGATTAPNMGNPLYQAKYKVCGFDFLTTYHQSNYGRVKAGANDYGSLIQGDKITWENISSYPDLKYLPSVSGGYDMRPWAADHPTLPASDFWFTGVTPQRLANHLEYAIQWAEDNEEQVFGNMLIIYAWNENGEGAWLTPTKANGTARLDAIKKVIEEVQQ